MLQPLELFIGLRYTRAKRRSYFVSFISMVSMVGIALGVMTLLTVMSVMNGFQDELRNRILGIISHATIESFSDKMEDWQNVKDISLQHEQVVGVSQYIMKEVMIAKGAISSGVSIRGVDPQSESKVSDVLNHVIEGSSAGISSRSYNILIGKSLADKLQVNIGDKVTVVTSDMQLTAAGLIPRMKRFTVTGLFDLGMYTFDMRLAIIHIDDASRLFRYKNAVSGIRIKTDDMDETPLIVRQVLANLDQGYWPFDWTQGNRNLFSAIKLQKKVMFIILSLVVAIAAFNLVSTLIMTVNDKRGDIAILRTLGLSRSGIVKIFIIQGSVIGVIGISLGVLFGVLLSYNISAIASFIESTFDIELMVKDVYLITKTLPAKILLSDVVSVCLISFILSIIATVFPAWRASKSPPAEALRYE